MVLSSQAAHRSAAADCDNVVFAFRARASRMRVGRNLDRPAEIIPQVEGRSSQLRQH
jgi:hypothetical protein